MSTTAEKAGIDALTRIFVAAEPRLGGALGVARLPRKVSLRPLSPRRDWSRHPPGGVMRTASGQGGVRWRR